MVESCNNTSTVIRLDHYHLEFEKFLIAKEIGLKVHTD